MKTGYAIALALAAFGAGAVLTGAIAVGSDMGNWTPEQMVAACRSMMQAAQPTP